MGGCDAEYTSVRKIWRPTATEMPSDASGKVCINDLKKCQHSSSKDGNIYALDRAHCGAQSKSLPDILPGFLSSERHPVHAERTQHDESALPPTRVAIIDEHVEARKVETCLQLTKSLRERLGDAGSARGGL